MVELNAKQRAAEKRENRMVIFLTIKPKTIPDSAKKLMLRFWPQGFCEKKTVHYVDATSRFLFEMLE